MSEIIGKQIELGVGVEKVRGVAQLTAEAWFKKISANITPRAEKKDDESTRNVLSDSLGTRLVKKWIEGDLEGNVHADQIGYLIYNLLGGVSSVNVSGSVYRHTFSLVTSIQHPSLTFFAKDGNVDQQSYSNGMVNTFELTAVVDDYVKFTASIMAKEAGANSDTPSYATHYDFVGKEVLVRFADSLAGLNSATPVKAKDITVTFDQGLIMDHILGQYEPDDIYNAKAGIEGSFSLNYKDTTFQDLYTADTYKYMRVSIIGNADIGGGNNPELVITLNRTAIKNWNREDATDELVNEPIEFKSYFNEVDGKMLEIDLQNLTVEYDTPISD